MNGGRRHRNRISKLILPKQGVPFGSLSNAQRTTWLAQQQMTANAKLQAVISALGDLTDIGNWLGAIVRAIEVTLELDEGSLVAAVEHELEAQRKATAADCTEIQKTGDPAKANCLGAKVILGRDFPPKIKEDDNGGRPARD